MNAPADPNFALRHSRQLRPPEVLRAGRTHTVTRGEVYAQDGKHIASMQQTLMTLAGTPDRPE